MNDFSHGYSSFLLTGSDETLNLCFNFLFNPELILNFFYIFHLNSNDRFFRALPEVFIADLAQDGQ